MAILTALFSLLSRKLADVLQAVFGWSILALFGRLNGKSRIILTVALVLSLMWPLFVLGAFTPKVASMVIAFVPIKGEGIARALRFIWLGLAILAPVVVGLLTRLVSPDARKASLLRSVLNGYPLTIGFAGAFLITLITVPLIRLSTIARGWSDEHVVLQPRPGHYLQALKTLCDACAMAGLEPRAAPVPRSMALATRLIAWSSRGAVDSLVLEHPLMVRAAGLELFLYPGDLLLRGERHLVTRVRAMINRAYIERDAYLVESDDGRHLQDELGRLWDALARHEPGVELTLLERRLKEIVADASAAKLSFDEVSQLERLAARVELAIHEVPSVLEEAGVKKTLQEVQRDQQQQARALEPVRGAVQEPGTVELVENALRDARELMQLELALARRELKDEVSTVTRAAVGFVLGFACVVVTLALLGSALVIALGGTALVALGVAGGSLVMGLIAGGVGYSLLPNKPLAKTRRHLSDDYKQLKEHLA
jgi:hypothetical protein